MDRGVNCGTKEMVAATVTRTTTAGWVNLDSDTNSDSICGNHDER